MYLPTTLLQLTTALTAALVGTSHQPTPSVSASASPNWNGTPPPTDGSNSGALVSACTFAVGPPGPSTGLCPAFVSYCTSYKDRYHRIKNLKNLKNRSPVSFSSSSSSLASGSETTSSPIESVKFRTGCTGNSGLASDGTYISGYTATCIVDGVEWVSFVFDEFLRSEFSPKDGQDPEIYYSFVGCQVPAHK